MWDELELTFKFWDQGVQKSNSQLSRPGPKPPRLNPNPVQPNSIPQLVPRGLWLTPSLFWRRREISSRWRMESDLRSLCLFVDDCCCKVLLPPHSVNQPIRVQFCVISSIKWFLAWWTSAGYKVSSHSQCSAYLHHVDHNTSTTQINIARRYTVFWNGNNSYGIIDL